MIKRHIINAIETLTPRSSITQTLWFSATIALAVLSITACQGQKLESNDSPSKEGDLANVTLALVVNHSFCQTTNAGMRQLHNIQEVKAVLAQQKPEHYDFRKYDYVLTSAGSRSTLGYSFNITAKQVQIDTKTQSVDLPILLTSPPKGRMQAQVMSQPCAIIEISKSNAKLLRFASWQVTLSN